MRYILFVLTKDFRDSQSGGMYVLLENQQKILLPPQNYQKFQQCYY